MGIIFMQKHLIWSMRKCAIILILIIHFHTGNVYYGAVPIFCVLIFLIKNKTKKHEETTPSIRFHIYHFIGRCTTHGIITLKDKKICYMCKQESSADKSTNIYTRKELVMIETTIYEFHTSFYIPTIQKLAFHLTHVRILGTNRCGERRRTAFKQCELFQDVLCFRDYSKRVIASFANQIKLEHYGGNRYVYIEGFILENFSALRKADIKSSTISCQRHAVFHSFYLKTSNRMLLLLLHTANN